MRIALKIGYDGTQFFGFACQPNLRTIQGDLKHALLDITGASRCHDLQFQYASRTDRGVSAAGNVIALTTELSREYLVYTLQGKLEDIWIRGVATVDKDFNPRHARQRWYRYFLQGGNLDLDKMREAAEAFTGHHDYTNYAKLEEKRPESSIDSIMITPREKFLCIDVKAHYFLWHQVRRIIAALEKVGKNMVDVDKIQASLDTPTHRHSFGNASPDYLILMDTLYTDIVFRKITMSHNTLGTHATWHQARALIFDAIRKTPKF